MLWLRKTEPADNKTVASLPLPLLDALYEFEPFQFAVGDAHGSFGAAHEAGNSAP